MASLSDKINAATAFFTAAAAIAAAVAAYYSFQQTDLSRKNQLDAERLAAFDKFTDKASEVCELFYNPVLENLWDSKNQRIRTDFDLTEAAKSPPDVNGGISLQVDDHVIMVGKIFSELNLQASRLIRLESKNFDASEVEKFIYGLEKIEEPLKNPPYFNNKADQIRYRAKEYHNAENNCKNSLGDLMKAYNKLLPLE